MVVIGASFKAIVGTICNMMNKHRFIAIFVGLFSVYLGFLLSCLTLIAHDTLMLSILLRAGVTAVESDPQ
jgi:energy-converting hydrogenase Eha subunit E